jgi:hypothetical protein
MPSPTRTETIVAGMGLGPRVGGRDTDLMACVVVQGKDIVADIGALRGRVGVTVVDSEDVTVRIGTLSALFGVIVRDSVRVRFEIGSASSWLPKDGIDQWPHVAYFQGVTDGVFSMKTADMGGDGRSEYGTAFKATLSTQIKVIGGNWKWPFGSIELAGCSDVDVLGGAYDGRGSTPTWRGSHSSFLIRNHHGTMIVPCSRVRLVGCTFLAGDGEVGGAVMHSDLGPNLGLSQETTPTGPGSRLVLGSRDWSSYAPTLPGLEVERPLRR